MRLQALLEDGGDGYKNFFEMKGCLYIYLRESASKRCLRLLRDFVPRNDTLCHSCKTCPFGKRETGIQDRFPLTNAGMTNIKYYG